MSYSHDDQNDLNEYLEELDNEDESKQPFADEDVYSDLLEDNLDFLEEEDSDRVN